MPKGYLSREGLYIFRKPQYTRPMKTQVTTILISLTLIGCGEGRLTSLEDEQDLGPDFAMTTDAGEDQSSTPDMQVLEDVGVPDASLPDMVPDMPPEICARLKVTVEASLTLNIRPTPSTAQAPVGSLTRGFVVAAVDLVEGEDVGGETRWYQIESPRGDGYVHYDFVECTEDELTTMPIGYYMPFACNAQHRVTQGPGGGTSHSGNAAFAYDFACGSGTSIRAMMGGTVSRLSMATQPGDPCYNGGTSACSNASNYIMLAHPNGQTTIYKHLNSASVAEGAQVSVGQEIGKSGNTGWSTGPHLHIGVCDGATTNQFCQTVDFSFVDIGKPGNVTVTSGNCP